VSRTNPRPSQSSRIFDAILNLPEVSARVELAITERRIDRGSVSRYRNHLQTPDIKTAVLLHELTGVAVEGWIPEDEIAKGAA
jgi:hypothetical protein